jgi:hypothetical protein
MTIISISLVRLELLRVSVITGGTWQQWELACDTDRGGQAPELIAPEGSDKAAVIRPLWLFASNRDPAGVLQS